MRAAKKAQLTIADVPTTERTQTDGQLREQHERSRGGGLQKRWQAGGRRWGFRARMNVQGSMHRKERRPGSYPPTTVPRL